MHIVKCDYTTRSSRWEGINSAFGIAWLVEAKKSFYSYVVSCQLVIDILSGCLIRLISDYGVLVFSKKRCGKGKTIRHDPLSLRRHQFERPACFRCCGNLLLTFLRVTSYRHCTLFLFFCLVFSPCFAVHD